MEEKKKDQSKSERKRETEENNKGLIEGRSRPKVKGRVMEEEERERAGRRESELQYKEGWRETERGNRGGVLETD